MSGAREFRPDVEGMRAVAVALVLLYHGGVPLVRAGFVGVDVCAPIIGNALIYRQGSHITATYIETLAPRLERALLATLR